MIHDNVLSGRIPRIGTITTGRGVEASAQSGRSYSKPSRSETLVFHCDDPEVANAVQIKFGGDVLQDSTSWKYDVVTESTRADVTLLPGGFRQSLEIWSASQCLRRCDGVMMSTYDGKSSNMPCACDASGVNERECKPHTVLPVLVDLNAERFGVWEVKSNGWSSAANLKGTMQALAITGRDVVTVPGVIEMRERLTKDATGQTRNIWELFAHIAVSNRSIGELQNVAPVELISGTNDLRAEWEELKEFAQAVGKVDRLREKFGEMFGDLRIEELSESDLRVWIDYARQECVLEDV